MLCRQMQRSRAELSFGIRVAPRLDQDVEDTGIGVGTRRHFKGCPAVFTMGPGPRVGASLEQGGDHTGVFVVGGRRMQRILPISAYCLEVCAGLDQGDDDAGMLGERGGQVQRNAPLLVPGVGVCPRFQAGGDLSGRGDLEKFFGVPIVTARDCI
jgi:hypothetical protein